MIKEVKTIYVNNRVDEFTTESSYEILVNTANKYNIQFKDDQIKSLEINAKGTLPGEIENTIIYLFELKDGVYDY